MSDIMITLSANPKLRSPSIGAEAAWLGRATKLHYPLHGRPRKAQKGDFVYFIRHGALAGRARITGFIVPGKARASYTRVRRAAPAAEVEVVTPLKPVKRCCLHAGFRGFRYVTPAERRAFEAAFR